MVDVFDLVICVALFIVSGKGVSGVSSRRELSAEDPNCEGAISVWAVHPTYNPESERQWSIHSSELSSSSLSLSAGSHSSSMDIHHYKVGRPGPLWLP